MALPPVSPSAPPLGMAPAAPSANAAPAMDKGPDPAQIAQGITDELPEPKKPYAPKVLAAMLDSTRDAWEAIKAIAPQLPPFPGNEELMGGYTGEGKLPVPVIMPALLLSAFATEHGGPAGKRYEIEVGDLDGDQAIKRVAAQMDVMAKDKKLAKALTDSLHEGEGEGEDEAAEAKDDMPPKKMGPPKGVPMGAPKEAMEEEAEA